MEEQENQVARLNQKTVKQEVSSAIVNPTISDSILRSFNELATQNQLQFPDNYNLGNQLKLAYLMIMQDSNLKTATPMSIGQALTEMALQGLEADKKQFYFIRYGNELKLFRSYFGDVAAVYRTHLVTDIKALVIYEGDEIETDIVNDQEVVIKHKTSFANRDNAIVGAYAIAVLPNGEKRYCIMTKKEIDKNWAKSKMKDSSVQRDFPQEMAKRTVIRRLVKMLFNTANTPDNYASAAIASFNRTTEDEYEKADEQAPASKTNVNNTIIDSEEVLDELEGSPEVSDTSANTQV